MTSHTEVESCEECKFDRADYTRDDLLGTLSAVAPMWRTMIEGMDEAVLAERPSPDVWSALEYAAHSRDVTASLALLAALALDEDHPRFEEEPPGPDDMGDPAVPGSMSAAIEQLEDRAAGFARWGASLDASDWSRLLTWGARTHDIEWIVAHAVHDATHHLKDVGRGLHALGAGAPSQRGSVVQINSSDGGVPKTPIRSADISRSGVVGDRQADRRHHGRPLQALCLWSEEVIDALRGEGHPIAPGLAGENLTLSGVDWTTLRPGVRLLVGDATIEISAWATPCKKNAAWFADGNFNRMNHDRHPGWSRAYAWVLESGSVSTGDEVLVEP